MNKDQQIQDLLARNRKLADKVYDLEADLAEEGELEDEIVQLHEQIEKLKIEDVREIYLFGTREELIKYQLERANKSMPGFWKRR